MEKGTATLAFAKAPVLDVATFAQAMTEASHRLRAVGVELRGTFESGRFRVAGSGQVFEAAGPAGPARVHGRLEPLEAPRLVVDRVE
ncbi:MAG: hypothetical protein HYY18_22375 [Planctomycetes bacterium]|nr:hypothetical protein [Planctomycetota bacterium]